MQRPEGALRVGRDAQERLEPWCQLLGAVVRTVPRRLPRRAEAEVVEDASDGEGVGHVRDDTHALAVAGTDERIHLVAASSSEIEARRQPERPGLVGQVTHAG